MREALQSKSNIAWFKLSELVMRGERERALSVFRLLSHSISDKAFVALLESELFHVFGDIRAKEACFRAISLYEAQLNYEKVVLAYSYIFEWWPGEEQSLDSLANLCDSFSSEVLWRTGMRLVVMWSIAAQRWGRVQDLVINAFARSSLRGMWLKKAIIYGIVQYSSLSEAPFFFESYCRELAWYYTYEGTGEERIIATQLFTLLSSFDQDLYQRVRDSLLE